MAPGGRLARWILARSSRDGVHLFGDILEAYAARGGGRLSRGLWFWQEVAVACWYGRRDAWAEGDRSWRGLLTLGLPLRTVRSLRRRPGYTVTVIVLTGAAAGSLSGLAGISRAMGGPDDPELTAVRVIVGTNPGRGWRNAFLSVPELDDLREGVDGLDDVGIFRPDATLGLGTEDGTRPVNVVFADASYFSILKARTELGRVFTGATGRGGERPFVILSHGLWRDAFASVPDIAGRSVRIAGRTFGVLGVMEEDFRDAVNGPPTDAWLPLEEVPAFYGAGALTTRVYRWVLAVTRLASGDGTRVAEEADRVAAELEGRYPEAHFGRGFAFRDLRTWWFGPVRQPVRVMLAGGGWLLLLVLGNLAALFRIRGQEREGEMALRSALGAGRGSLLWVVLGEAAVLATASALLGFGVAELFVRGSAVHAVLGLPQFATPGADMLTVLGCAGLILPLSLLFGFGGRAARVGSRRRSGRWLLAVEAALAATLLTVAGALVQDVRAVARTPTGFDPDGLLTARVDLTEAATDPRVLAGAPGRRVAFSRAFVSGSANIPGVAGAALVGPGVLGRALAHMEIIPEGLDPGPYAGRWLAQRIVLTPGGLETLGINLLAGRPLRWSDDGSRTPVAVVDERIARRFWPDGDAVGRTFCPDATCRFPFTVVGVAEVAKNRGRGRSDAIVVGDLYVSYAQQPTASGTAVVRTDGVTGDVAGDVRRLVSKLAPGAMLSDVQWMGDRLRAEEAVQRWTASLIAAYAAMAALLALVGTYGLVAVQLGRGWRDTAVRMALGARWLALARGLVVEGIAPTALGVMAGAAAGLAAAPALTTRVSQLAGIGHWSWPGAALVSGLLLAGAVGASALPLLKLRLLRPMEVLRAD